MAGKGKPGRAKWLPTTDQLGRLAKLTGRGMTLEHAALHVGVSYVTLNERIKDTPEVLLAIQKGRADYMAKLTEKLDKSIDDGETSSLHFAIRMIGGWQERHEVTGPDGGPVSVVHAPVGNKRARTILEHIDKARKK